MHVLGRRLPAGQAPPSPKAKRLSNSNMSNPPVYPKKKAPVARVAHDVAVEKRQTVVTNSAVVFTGSGFTFTLNGPATFTVGNGAATNPTTTIGVDQGAATTSTPAQATDTVAQTQQAAPPISFSSGLAVAPPPSVPTPVASLVTTTNPKSTSSSLSNGSSNVAAQNNEPLGATSAKSSGLPTGAIVGIALAIVVIVLGAFVFLVRQRAIRQRKLKRATQTWMGGNGGMGAAGFAQPAPLPAGSFAGGDAEKNGAMMSETPYSAGASFARAQAAALASPAPPVPTLAAPPSAYGAMATYPAAVAPTYGSTQSTATVRYEFIPSLPDELSIVTGEVVRLISEYDDGWALCANARNEQGMVPLECLDRATGASAGAPPQGGQRNSRRGSSLGVRY